jgi:sugar lactone lactonase YvrE
MRKRRRFEVVILGMAVLALLTVGPGRATAAPILYGSNGNDGNAGALVTIDPTTAQGTVIGTPLPGSALSGLAFLSNTDLFASTVAGFNGSSTLIRINPDTGALIGTAVPITVSGVPISIGDLSIQPGTGVLYGLRSNEDPFKLGGRLYTINPATGVATFVGSTGAVVGGGIAFAPDGTFYQTTILNGVPVLNTLNPATGAVITSVPDSLFFDSLGISPDGRLFASDGGDTIYTINPITGAPSFIGFTGTGHPSDLDFRPAPVAVAVPEPSSLAVFALAGAVAVLYRRSRKKRAQAAA